MKERKRIKNVIVVGSIFCSFWALWVFLTPLFSGSGFLTWAAQEQFLADKHKEVGLDCQGCHQENPPARKVETPVCQSCHGDYAKVAARTEKVEPNPHASHEGYQPCDVCHHAHKPSVDRCGECHNFGFKVP
jgi:Cytochrome c3